MSAACPPASTATWPSPSARPTSRAPSRSWYLATATANRPSPDPGRGIGAGGLIDICGGDDAFARELAASFLESAPRCLGGIEDALRAGDRRDAGREAHGLKGISRTIGADDLADACRRWRTRRIEATSGGPAAEAMRVVDAWEASAGRPRTSLRRARNQSMKILIAEDQPPAALFLRRTLEKMGHEAAVAPDGEQAWRIVRERRCTALDLRLDDAPPRRPRAVPAHPGREDDRYIYIILLTSRDRREDRLNGLRAGADDFLTKPPDPDELAVRLEIAERILAMHEQLARQNARLAELATIDELTGAKNRRRFREDLELLFAQADRQARRSR